MRTTGARRAMLLRAGASVLGAALLVSACGSSGGESDKSAADILRDAATAFGSVHSYHLALTGTTGEAGAVTVSLDVASGTSAKGHVSLPGASADLVATGGKLYIRGSQLFTRLGGALGRQIAAAVGDRWASVPQSSFGDLSPLAPSHLAGCLRQRIAGATKAGTTDVGGAPAAEVDLGSGSAAVKAFVANTGTPYLLRLTGAGAGLAGSAGSTGGGCSSPTALVSVDRGTADLSNFNASVPVTAPAGAVDLSTILGG